MCKNLWELLTNQRGSSKHVPRFVFLIKLCSRYHFVIHLWLQFYRNVCQSFLNVDPISFVIISGLLFQKVFKCVIVLSRSIQSVASPEWFYVSFLQDFHTLMVPEVRVQGLNVCVSGKEYFLSNKRPQKWAFSNIDRRQPLMHA